MNMRQLAFFLLWAAFILYAWLAAPSGNQGYLNQLIQMNDPDPLLLTVFSLLGVFPAAFLIILLSHDHSRLPAWPFAAGAFVLGAFALLPYFFLSSLEKDRKDRIPKIIKRFLNTKVLHAALLLGSIFLIGNGLWNGNAGEYAEAFLNSQFVHVMTIDLVVLTGLSVYALYWDQWKTGVRGKKFLWAIIPVVGIFIYLWLTSDQRGERIAD